MFLPLNGDILKHGFCWGEDQPRLDVCTTDMWFDIMKTGKARNAK